MTALTAYISSTTSTTLSTANELLAAAPSSELDILIPYNNGTTGWGELYSSSNALTTFSAAGSEPTPSGKGYLYDVTTLEGQAILAGTWTPTVKLSIIGSGLPSIVADIHVRAYKRSSAGVYTQILDSVKSGQTINYNATVFTGFSSNTTSTPTSFLTGDKLYIDYVLNITTPFGSSGTRHIAVYYNGGANESIVTPGYSIPETDLTASINQETSVTANISFATNPSGTSSLESFGGPTLVEYVKPTSISSLEAFGLNDYIYDWIHPVGITSAFLFGTTTIAQRLNLVSISSLEAFGIAGHIGAALFPYGIPSAVKFGSFTSTHDVVDTSIPSAEAFGTLEIAFPVPMYSTTSSEVFGVPLVGFSASNLSTLIWVYDPDFFSSLQTKETYCYAQPSGLSTYGSGFTTLSNNIVSWIQTDRKSLMKNFMNAFFSYIVMNKMYSTDNSMVSLSKYNNVWSIDGLIQTVEAAADTYYADGTGTQLSTDAAYVTSNGPNDDTKANTYITDYTDVVSAQIMNNMFDPTPPAPASWSKAAVSNQIFNTLGYKNLYNAFNIGMSLPPGV
jgi:hypothetical protein